MFRSWLARLSGTPLAILVIGAILVPGTLGAVAAFSYSAIIDPVSGNKVSVDASSEMRVVDTIALYAKDPRNIVEIQLGIGNGSCSTYTPPAGKALVLQRMTGHLFPNDSSQQFAAVYLLPIGSCSGSPTVLAEFLAPANVPFANIVLDFGAGIPIPAGTTISPEGIAAYGFAILHGYLVPANLVTSNQVVYLGAARPSWRRH